MVWIPHDYHLHSHFSPDSQQPITAICEQALALGIEEIAITDHADFIEYESGRDYYDPDGYFAELEQAREQFAGRLTLRAGVEIGEPHRFPDRTRELLRRYPYDVVIGSLHWVGRDLILSNEYFDGRDVEAAYRAYFEELLEMVKVAEFDIVGHVDVGKRYGYDVHGYYDVSPYEEELRAIYRVLVERGKGIEINHGSLRREVREAAPNLEALRWYREEGGEILTLGSDGHRPNGVGYCLGEAVKMATTAGFDRVTRFAGREPMKIPIDS